MVGITAAEQRDRPGEAGLPVAIARSNQPPAPGGGLLGAKKKTILYPIWAGFVEKKRGGNHRVCLSDALQVQWSPV